MKKYSLLYVTFALLIVIGALHLVAQVFYFYWILWWFDMLMHFLGGLAVGLFAIWVLFHSNIFFKRIPKRAEAGLVALIAVLIVGIGWEIFEYVNDISIATEGYVPDTFHDLLFDILGAGLGSLFASEENQST